MEKYKVEIELLGDVVQNRPHPISGKDKINWDDIPDDAQLQMRGYLTEKNTYGLPLTYFNGCIRDFFVEFCPWGNDGVFSSKEKRSTYISGKLRFIPIDGCDLLDTGINKAHDLFNIKKDPIAIDNKGTSCLSTPTQPVLRLRGIRFLLDIVSAIDDRPKEEIAKLINDAGIMNGIGSWRTGGKGRFKVVSIIQV